MKACVLVVDDDPVFRSALETVLLEADFDVRTAKDGKEAIAILNKEHGHIDVAIVDLNIPEISGFEVIGAISRRKTTMGILATTGVYKEPFLEVAQYLGANITIRKPHDLSQLQSWIPAIRSVIKAEGEMGSASGALS
jgi:DNA-binding response OmpR family regulator